MENAAGGRGCVQDFSLLGYPIKRQGERLISADAAEDIQPAAGGGKKLIPVLVVGIPEVAGWVSS